PATSTMGEIVKRAGLVVARKKRRRTEPYTEPLGHAVGPNRVWGADFKGWFRSGDGTRIDLSLAFHSRRLSQGPTDFPHSARWTICDHLRLAFRRVAVSY
ncbi:MAG: hypothetical protein ABSE53_13805, partial [Terracidiphilus sp.]